MISDIMRKTTNGAPSLDRKDRLRSWSAIAGTPLWNQNIEPQIPRISQIKRELEVLFRDRHRYSGKRAARTGSKSLGGHHRWNRRNLRLILRFPALGR